MESPHTPMLRQYQSIKAKHQNCILFFRLGDFYEMFYEDAKVASKALDLVLTARGKAPSQRVPMCGVPYHAADGYIAKLIKAGFKVAICEQLEDPAAVKGIVERDVTRIITSGTYLDEQTPDQKYLLSLSPNGKTIGVSFTDLSTGTIQTNQYPLDASRLAEIIANLPVSEIIFPDSTNDRIAPLLAHPLLKLKTFTLSPYEDWCFNPDMAKKTLCEHFAITNLHGFGIEELEWATSASGALLEYLRAMNKQPLRHIDKIALYTDEDYVFISPAAHRGLELDVLIHTLDKTCTTMGKRKLKSWFYQPLKTKHLILERQEATQALKDQPVLQQDLKALLNSIPDLEKHISRLSCGYTHARDLLAIRNALALIPAFQETLARLKTANIFFAVDDMPKLRETLTRAVEENIPLAHPEGNVIASGYNAELDELKHIQDNGRQWLKNFQERESKRAGIASLKVGFNKVFGYYIEITKTHANKIPRDYIRKQTLVNAERYITPELKEYEEKILTAQERVNRIETGLIEELKKMILDHAHELHRFCASIATIDCLYSFSVLALNAHYVKPNIATDPLIDIKEGRHPVVERNAATFVANDTYLDATDHRLIILTGPNMAGKSTYIRQSALLVIMAQAGSFIPAKSAHIGLVDKVFTRIGAHDDIARGQSTFMVEMNEMADILNNLTERSLVVLDEIGRGTSTYDGLSLAWALAEYLHGTKARVMFATHFHELTALADKHTGIKNYNVAVKEWKDEIVFLHKIVPGSTDDSYGIYVAKLAGIPEKVITHARHILTQLEIKNDLKEHLKGNAAESQLHLFTSNDDPVWQEVKKTLAALDVNNVTPVEALNQLQRLKDTVQKARNS